MVDKLKRLKDMARTLGSDFGDTMEELIDELIDDLKE